MGIFILLAGAWHTSRCWKRIVPLLEDAGHNVLTPDLLGVGDQGPATRASLAGWTDQIASLAQAQPEPVILVAHSRAGIVASMVAEQLPEKIRYLAFVSGSLIPAGGSIMTHGPQQDPSAPNPLQMRTDGTATLPDDVARHLFLNRTSPEWAQIALSDLVPEPIWTFAERVQVTSSRFGAVPRAYVETLDDHALPIGIQRDMRSALPCDPVFTIDTDHSSFYSAPGELVRALLDIGDRQR